jgi:hypothetical protein
MPSVVIIHHSPFADEDQQDEQPRHFAREGGSDYGRLIDLHIARAEAELRFWEAHKTGDKKAADKAATEGERLSKQITAMCGDDDERGDNDGD